MIVALTQAEGVSIVHETVYENRFGFTDALIRMGANIQVHRECLGSVPCRFGQRNFLHSAVISGPTQLKGTDIDVPDLRGGFSHLIAALAATGTSRVTGIDIINRGYERFTEKLAGLGADFDITVSQVTGTCEGTGEEPHHLCHCRRDRPARDEPADEEEVGRASKSSRPGASSPPPTTAPRSTRWWSGTCSTTRSGCRTSSPRPDSSRSRSWEPCCAPPSRSRWNARRRGRTARCSIAKEVVDEGGAIVIYPEGTLTRDPELWPMKGHTGAARMALESGIPVVPMAHWGAHEVFPRYAKRFHVFPAENVPPDRRRSGGPQRLCGAAAGQGHPH